MCMELHIHAHSYNEYAHSPPHKMKIWGTQHFMAPSVCSRGHSLYECTLRCTFMYVRLSNVYGSATPTHSSDECVCSFPETQTEGMGCVRRNLYSRVCLSFGMWQNHHATVEVKNVRGGLLKIREMENGKDEGEEEARTASLFAFK